MSKEKRIGFRSATIFENLTYPNICGYRFPDGNSYRPRNQ